MLNELPLISVIISTKNEERHIGNSLSSIKKQTYPQNRIEIILVDNNSIDKTREIAQKFTDKIYLKGPERSAQRNYGIVNSQGKYLLYLDADMILTRTIISECVKQCEEEKYDALYIPEIVIGYGYFGAVRNFERSFYNRTCLDAVRFIRRSILNSIGLFDESLTGTEDWDLDRRIKNVGKCGIIDAPLFHDERESNIRDYIRKKTYYFTNIKKYIEKWGLDPITRKQLGLQYRLIGVFIENGKWRKLLKNPSLTFGMYALKLAVALLFLKSSRLSSIV